MEDSFLGNMIGADSVKEDEKMHYDTGLMRTVIVHSYSEKRLKLKNWTVHVLRRTSLRYVEGKEKKE